MNKREDKRPLYLGSGTRDGGRVRSVNYTDRKSVV